MPETVDLDEYLQEQAEGREVAAVLLATRRVIRALREGGEDAQAENEIAELVAILRRYAIRRERLSAARDGA